MNWRKIASFWLVLIVPVYLAGVVMAAGLNPLEWVPAVRYTIGVVALTVGTIGSVVAAGTEG